MVQLSGLPYNLGSDPLNREVELRGKSISSQRCLSTVTDEYNQYGHLSTCWTYGPRQGETSYSQLLGNYTSNAPARIVFTLRYRSTNYTPGSSFTPMEEWTQVP